MVPTISRTSCPLRAVVNRQDEEASARGDAAVVVVRADGLVSEVVMDSSTEVDGDRRLVRRELVFSESHNYPSSPPC